MEIQQLEKSRMDAVKELADTSMKISESKNILLKLQEKETEYLIAREEKAINKINKVLEESKDLLDKTQGNYEQIHIFCRTVSEYADFLSEAQGKFQKMLELFEERNKLWEENAQLQYAEIARQRKITEQDTKAIETREKKIEEATKSLQKDREYIESQRASLLAAYSVEQKLWDKIQRK
jgi:hypothetical protein